MITEMNLEEKVRLVGHCEDMPAAFMMSDVVVSATASKPEAFGRIAIEAQAMAKPVIASAHGGSLETILDQHLEHYCKSTINYGQPGTMKPVSF